MFNKIDLTYDGPVRDESLSWQIVVLVLTALLLTMAGLFVTFVGDTQGLQPYVANNIGDSGVTNPVTAVLLNFRAYDTLLEVAVLLIVVIAVLPNRNTSTAMIRYIPENTSSLVLLAIKRWIAPATTLFAGYLLWAGAYQPGGAFQAGALLAGAGVLLFQGGAYHVNYTSLLGRLLLIIGLMVFVSAALYLTIAQGSLLTFSPATAGALILLIETAVTVSIALSLTSLYSSIIEQDTISAHRASAK